MCILSTEVNKKKKKKKGEKRVEITDFHTAKMSENDDFRTAKSKVVIYVISML